MFSKLHAYLRKPQNERMPIDWAAEIARHPEPLHKMLESVFQNPIVRNLYEDALYKNGKKLKISIGRINGKTLAHYNFNHHLIKLNSHYMPEDTDKIDDLSDTFIHELRHAWQNASGFSDNVRSDPYSRFIQNQMMELDANAFSVFAKHYMFDKNFGLECYKDMFEKMMPTILDVYGDVHTSKTYIPLIIPPNAFIAINGIFVLGSYFTDLNLAPLLAVNLSTALKIYKNRYKSHEYNPEVVRSLFDQLTFRDENGKVNQILTENKINDCMKMIQSLYISNGLDSYQIHNLRAFALRMGDIQKFPGGKYIAPIVA